MKTAIFGNDPGHEKMKEMHPYARCAQSYANVDRESVRRILPVQNGILDTLARQGKGKSDKWM